MHMLTTNKKSYAFIAAYLLGMAQKKIEQKFPEEYIFSSALENFKSINKAEDVRNLVILRTRILHHIAVEGHDLDSFDQIKSITAIDALAYLDEKGYKLRMFPEMDNTMATSINEINKILRTLVPKVLQDLRIGYQEEFALLFKHSEVSKKNLATKIRPYREKWADFPFGVVISKGSQYMLDVAYMFDSDERFLEALKKINTTDSLEDVQNFDKYPFVWSVCVKDLNLPDVRVNPNSTFYVDCDNISFKVFLTLLEALDKGNKGKIAKNNYVFNLYLDADASPIWKLTPKILKNNFTYNIIPVPRIKDNKSLVDIFITSDIAKSHAQLKEKEQQEVTKCIVSSDSDFYGLVLQDIPLHIFYYDKDASYQYVNQINLLQNTTKTVKTFNLSKLNIAEHKNRYHEEVLSFTILQTMYQSTIQDWTVEKIIQGANKVLKVHDFLGVEALGNELEILVQKVIEGYELTSDPETHAPILKYNELIYDNSISLI